MRKMDLSSAVLWWEEWQLRILVLGSLFVQYVLLFSAPLRKHALPSWFRSIIWLAYLGSDALAIYALATLFSRQTKQVDPSSAQAHSILEVLWAPVLLMHLGGHDSITAYNIEDNELWTRHVLTAVSQITVAIYVFCKSWRNSDMKLLKVAILFFIPGVLKCIEKPWTLKNASINSLISSPRMTSKVVGENKTLQGYVQEATTDCVEVEAHEAQEQGNPVDSPSRAPLHILQPSRLFVDIASSYADRLNVLTFFKPLADKEAYDLLQEGLNNIFDLFYTKETVVTYFTSSIPLRHPWLSFCGYFIRSSSMYLPLAAIGLFHKSDKEAYSDDDVKITYALFCSTVVLEVYFLAWKSTQLPPDIARALSSTAGTLPSLKPRLAVLVGQYSLVGFFVRNKRHAKKMCIASFLQCKDFLDQRWSMKPCRSSFFIIKLVLEYVKKGWKDQIRDVDSYWKFNDRRGQWTLEENGCIGELGWSLRRPFDESVILWHIATDFCFYYKGASADHECATARCNQENASGGQGHGSAAWCERPDRSREMSNYMAYLLFVNPEMLMAGTSRNMFMSASTEVEELLEDDKLLLKKIRKAKKLSLKEILSGRMSRIKEILDGRMLRRTETPRGKNTLQEIAMVVMSMDTKILKAENKWLGDIEREVMQVITAKLQPTECTEQVVRSTESAVDAEKSPTTQLLGSIHDALKLHKTLLALGDEKKMWEVIEGVWVEMLCFSASRCRGYLHAKSLGTGGELLTLVWLLLSHMGMETLPERLQKTELSSGEGNTSAPSSNPLISATAGEDIV